MFSTLLIYTFNYFKFQSPKNIQNGRDQEENASDEAGEGQCHGQSFVVRTTS